MKHIDCRGQKCPQPVILTKKALLDEPEEAFYVLVDDQVCQENVSRLAKSLGYSIDSNMEGAAIGLVLTPGLQPAEKLDAIKSSGPTIIFIGSDEMGHGDSKLGQILLKNFIFTLTEADKTPDTIYCVNSGVKLTIGGSDVLEPLEELANRGVDIASCGLCLEYFDAKESLVVGRISNMLELVNALEGAGNIIRL
ncbi:MAG: sulfurtransferase-like selenium metabolism protein YedF [Desulfuromonadales bacterium]|nr:sulfurtransferase-like selenium metabolism protein YedF [Desulfuromonadales bacterium]